MYKFANYQVRDLTSNLADCAVTQAQTAAHDAADTDGANTTDGTPPLGAATRLAQLQEERARVVAERAQLEARTMLDALCLDAPFLALLHENPGTP